MSSWLLFTQMEYRLMDGKFRRQTPLCPSLITYLMSLVFKLRSLDQTGSLMGKWQEAYNYNINLSLYCIVGTIRVDLHFECSAIRMHKSISK